MFCGLGLAAAQQTDPGTTVIGRPFEPAALKQYLALTDAQVRALQQLQDDHRQAERKVYEQIREKDMQLQQLLRAGSSDAFAIGQLMVEINNLRRQLPISREPFRAPALAVLTEPQQAKLSDLTEALRIAPAGHQAVDLNLIDSPQRDEVWIQPYPMPRVDGAEILPFPAREQ
ncbi:MAG: periplasmic heavy metal sensor [Bryobacterales bacterium]|nr:periplasmic heavy metal sensor [Bryobacterales bacterium]